MRRFHPLCGLVVLLTAFTPAAGAAALPGPSKPVRAGGFEAVFLGPAVPGVEERELILSLDGGRTYPLRLTGEVGPEARRLSWRVPALPTTHAVLALREGGEDVEETIVTRSDEFTILVSRSDPAEEVRLHAGEWWTREADRGTSLPAASLGDSQPARWELLAAGPDVLQTGTPARPAPPSFVRGFPGLLSPTTPVPLSGEVGNLPLFFPRRE